MLLHGTFLVHVAMKKLSHQLHECTLSFQLMQDGTCRPNPSLSLLLIMAS